MIGTSLLQQHILQKLHSLPFLSRFPPEDSVQGRRILESLGGDFDLAPARNGVVDLRQQQQVELNPEQCLRGDPRQVEVGCGMGPCPGNYLLHSAMPLL